jgi:hypothetical protein
MPHIKYLILPILIVLFSSCKNEQKNTYAIRDFRKSLHPFLVKIVTEGIVRDYDSAEIKIIKDNELLDLSKSENPVLRATAFREILERNNLNHFDLLMNHLNDTAIVPTDAGEFGIWYRTVSDDILYNANWETVESKNRTVEQVLTKHNYLRSAYFILNDLEPQEKYYPYIKDMATRPRRLDIEGNELDFGDIEYALYGLAKFKKHEDIQIIKKQMMRFVWRLSDVSFKLMKEFPNPDYFDVLRNYHYRMFYGFSGNRPHGFSGFIADRAAPEDFIQALVVQQSDHSARLLDTMLNILPKRTCMPDKENIIREVIIAIWEHPCPAYARLREKIKPKAEEIMKGRIEVYRDPISMPADTTEEIIRW